MGLLLSSKALVQLILNPAVGTFTGTLGYTKPLLLGNLSLLLAATRKLFLFYLFERSKSPSKFHFRVRKRSSSSERIICIDCADFQKLGNCRIQMQQVSPTPSQALYTRISRPFLEMERASSSLETRWKGKKREHSLLSRPQCSRSAKLTKYCSWHEASKAFPPLVSAFPACRWSPPNTRKRTRGRGSWASSLEASRWGYSSDIRLAPFSTTSRGKWPPSSSSPASSSSPYVRTFSSFQFFRSFPSIFSSFSCIHFLKSLMRIFPLQVCRFSRSTWKRVPPR